MARPEYAVLTFDLATARTAERIVDAGKKYDGVTVLSLAAGGAASLAFGENGQLVPVFSGLSLAVNGERDGCKVPADEGLILSNPAGAGFLVLLVSYAGLVSTT